MNRCDYSRIPQITREAIDAWVHRARPTGGFLSAVLQNDLRSAVGHADEEHVDVLPVIVAYLVNLCPVGCWGSESTMEDWRRLGGMSGINARERVSR